MKKRVSFVLVMISATIWAISAAYFYQGIQERQQMLGAVEKLKTTGSHEQYRKDKTTEQRDKKNGNRKKKEGEEDLMVEPVSVNVQKITKEHSRVVAWIEIPDTPISYPVVQGEDNEYYLSHTFWGEESPYGSIFLDCENTSNFADSHSVVYGHNMQDGLMFAFLNQYENHQVMQQHPYIYVYTESKAFVYRIFSVYQARLGDVSYEIGLPVGSRRYNEQLECLVRLSEYDTGTRIDPDAPFLTLFTCNSNLSDWERMAVHAILEEEFEKITKLPEKQFDNLKR